MTGETGVTVDRDFARFGNKSYATNKINSVEVRSRHPHGQGAMFVWGLLGIISPLTAVGGAGIGYFLVGIVCCLLAFFAWRKSQIVEYQLFLMTSSSEAQAISSLNGEMIQRLRNRIESAMSGQLT